MLNETFINAFTTIVGETTTHGGRPPGPQGVACRALVQHVYDVHVCCGRQLWKPDVTGLSRLVQRLQYQYLDNARTHLRVNFWRWVKSFCAVAVDLAVEAAYGDATARNLFNDAAIPPPPPTPLLASEQRWASTPAPRAGTLSASDDESEASDDDSDEDGSDDDEVEGDGGGAGIPALTAVEGAFNQVN